MSLILKKVAYRGIITGAFLCTLFASCNYDPIPGPQISTSIENSKSHGVFLCSYKVRSNKINGIPIESIFAEKKYFLNEGLFGRFDINCCQSQLIIIFKYDNGTTTLNDIPQTWDIIGFDQQNSQMMIKYYQDVNFPDTIQLTVRPNVKEKEVENVVLNKE